jgi:hypothetical protein
MAKAHSSVLRPPSPAHNLVALPQSLTPLLSLRGRRYPLNLIILAVFTLFEGMAVGTVVSFYESRIVIQGAPLPPLLHTSHRSTCRPSCTPRIDRS